MEPEQQVSQVQIDKWMLQPLRPRGVRNPPARPQPQTAAPKPKRRGESVQCEAPPSANNPLSTALHAPPRGRGALKEEMFLPRSNEGPEGPVTTWIRWTSEWAGGLASGRAGSRAHCCWNRGSVQELHVDAGCASA